MISNEEIFAKLISIENLLKDLLSQWVNNSLDEVSIYEAARLMKLSKHSVEKLIENNVLPARKVESRRSSTGYSYKIKREAIKLMKMKPDTTSYAREFDLRKVAGI